MRSVCVRLVALCVILALAPWAGSVTVFGAPKGDLFTAAQRNQPTTLDPAIGSDAPSTKYLIAAYEPLVRNRFGTLDERHLEGVLATSWDISSDGLRYTFHLRPGVKFHDGSQLDAESVKVSIERMKTINLGNAYVLSAVQEVNAVSPLTVQITLSEPYAPFIQALTLVYIVSSTAVKEHQVNGDLAQGWFRDHEAGSGPYRLDSWQLGQQMQLSAFPDYWRGWSGNHAKTLILRLVAEPATQRLLVQSGEVDWADSITTDDIIALRQDKAVREQRSPGLAVFYLMMNTKKPPLADVRVRQALVAAFPYDQMLKGVLHGLMSPANGYLAPGFPEHDHGAPAQFDLARARQLLGDAGYSKGGFTLTLVYFNPLDYESLGSQLFADQLQNLGITLKLQGLPWASLLQRKSDPDIAQEPDLVFYNVTPGFGSPDSILYPTFYSKSTHWGHFNYANPKVDAMLDQARRTLNASQRTALYVQIQRQLRADTPGIPLMLWDIVNVYSARVTHADVASTSAFVIDYYTIQLGQ